MNQGDRLAFSNGIVGLSVFAAILLVVFGGDTHALIPLYMIGVFVSFTLSQAGMVVRWRRLRGAGLAARAPPINGVGAFVTGIVLLVVAVTKAHEGAWIIILLIPVHVFFFRATRRHYDGCRSSSRWTAGARADRDANRRARARSAASSAPSSRRSTTRGRCRPTCARCTSNVDPAATEQLESAVGRHGARACRWSSSSRRIAR